MISQRDIFFRALLSGVLAGVGYAFPPLGILLWFAFVPLLSVLDKVEGRGVLVRTLYASFFVFHGIANWWVSSWQAQADPFLMASGFALWLGHPFFFSVPLYFTRWVMRVRGRLVGLASFPVFWTAFEYLHGLGEISYPWLSIGYSQVDTLFIGQTADLWGVYGIGFFLAAGNALLALALGEGKFRRPALASFAVLASVLVFTGFLRYRSVGVDSGHVVAAVVQPNIDPWRKWSYGGIDFAVDLHMRLQDSLRRATEGGIGIAFWSETAIPYTILDGYYSDRWGALRGWVDTSGVSLVSGFADLQVWDSRSGAAIPVTASRSPEDSTLFYQTFNAAFGLSPGTVGRPPVHRKARLTPFAERLPYAETFSFAIEALRWGVGISSWGIGTKAEPLRCSVPGGEVRVGTIICIESIYPDFVRQLTDNGAELLCVITNDGWFDNTPGPQQHFVIARMRAIENRRWIVRSANTGVSGFIDSRGKVSAEMPARTSVAAAHRVGLSRSLSPYVRYGDIVPAVMLCVLAPFFILVAAFRRGRSI